MSVALQTQARRDEEISAFGEWLDALHTFVPDSKIVSDFVNLLLGRGAPDGAMYSPFGRHLADPDTVFCYRRDPASPGLVGVEVRRVREGQSLDYELHSEHLGLASFSSSVFPGIAELGERLFRLTPRNYDPLVDFKAS